MTDNWYIALELEFDPPVMDEKVIEARIEERRKYWSMHMQDFKKGPQYSKWLNSLSQIKADMLGSDNIREELAADAIKHRNAPIDRSLRLISRGRVGVTDAEIEKIASIYNVTSENVIQRVNALKVGREHGGGKSGQLYEKYYKTKPKMYNGFKTHDVELQFFNAKNFYDFLYKGDKNASSLPAATIKAEAEERKKTYIKPDAESSNGSKLCQACIDAFASDEDKKAYDVYLDYINVKKLLDEVKETAKISGRIRRETAYVLENSLTFALKDRELSGKLLAEFCAAENIVLDSNAQLDRSMYKVCRCGCTNDVSDGRKVCRECGSPLVIKCPRCGAENDANLNFCRCGFDITGIDKAKALCEQAEKSLDALELEAAAIQLDKAYKLWNGLEKGTDLRIRLRDVSLRVGDKLKKMRIAMKENYFFRAKELINEIKKFFPDFNDKDTEDKIKQSIDMARAVLDKNTDKTDEEALLKICASAAAICRDLPEIKELLAPFPPDKPRELVVLPDPEGRVNIITWDADKKDDSVYFRVVRKKQLRPLVPNDGEEVAVTALCSCTDKDPAPGEAYFYAVFAERWGVYSQPLVYEDPVVNMMDIKNVDIIPGEGSVTLVWGSVPANASVCVCRQNDAGVYEKVASVSDTSYTDSGLINGRRYIYKVLLSYDADGKKMLTNGVEGLEGVPVCLLLPPENLIIRHGSKEGEFEAIWKYSQNRKVELYGCTGNIPFEYGAVVPLEKLEQKMQHIQTAPLRNAVLKPDEGAVRFKYFGREAVNVAAAVINDGKAVIGARAVALRNAGLKIRSISISGGKVSFLLDAPDDTTGFVVLYRDDRFPNGISERYCERKYVTKAQYDHDGSLIIPISGNRKFYFTVYAEFISGGVRSYSAGCEYFFDNTARIKLIYTVSVSKGLFGDTTAVINIGTDPSEIRLPSLTVAAAEGSVPTSKNGAMVLLTTTEQNINGRITLRVPISRSLPPDMYVGLFITDDRIAGNYEVIENEYSDNRLT